MEKSIEKCNKFYQFVAFLFYTDNIGSFQLYLTSLFNNFQKIFPDIVQNPAVSQGFWGHATV
jgi:hypothetical protein